MSDVYRIYRAVLPARPDESPVFEGDSIVEYLRRCFLPARIGDRAVMWIDGQWLVCKLNSIGDPDGNF